MKNKGPTLLIVCVLSLHFDILYNVVIPHRQSATGEIGSSRHDKLKKYISFINGQVMESCTTTPEADHGRSQVRMVCVPDELGSGYRLS